jgi:type VI secretion system protein ImpL
MALNDGARVAILALGLIAVDALIYIAGPFVAFGDFRPLESSLVREIVILLLTLAVAGYVGFLAWRKRQKNNEVAEGISAQTGDDTDAPILAERMKDALKALKEASNGRSTYLYDLPWYLLIGPPGSGKTTALVNSGLRFPLAKNSRPTAVSGVGGTRYCDWWFTEDAVLIDTAGRYTTQDSDAKADQKSWFAFLDTLKKGRPKQPINGVIVAISVEDLLTLQPVELAAHAAAIRGRLLELHTRLKVDFPVYALFTKADLILGFSEFFQIFDNLDRAQVFGATFQTADKTSNLVSQVPAEFDSLLTSLSDMMSDRLQDEPAPVARVQLYGFPTQLAALKRPLYDFLNLIFEPTRYHANATLRGFYLTSGTQQGTPIDQLISALEQSFKTVEVASDAFSGEGKSYFLTDLIKKVIIGEAAWVSTDIAAVRRAAILKACAYAGLIVCTIGMASLWWLSYGRNSALINQTQASVADYTKADNGISQKTTIADNDLSKILPLLTKLRNLPGGYAEKDKQTPLAETFGLSQRDRLQSSAIISYQNALERMFRPRLIYRLEEVLEANRRDPGSTYAALKVYMLLGHLAPTNDSTLILDWMRNDWTENLYPGSGNETGRLTLEEHLKAMLDLEDSKPLVTLSRPILEAAQKSLAQLSVTQRAYELLKSTATTSAARPNWYLTKQGSLQAASIFEPTGAEALAAINVPYFYTYAGFNTGVLPRLRWAAEQVDKERWVLGDFAAQGAISEQYKTLQRDVLDLYMRDFIATWQEMLGKFRLKRLTADKSYIALTALASPTSPLKQVLQSIRDETNLDRPHTEGEAKPSGAQLSPVPAPAASSDANVLLNDGPPAAAVDDAFRPFQDALNGELGQRPIDLVIKSLSMINADLKRAATNPSEASQSNADLQTQVETLRTLATSLPSPFANMMQKAASDFDNAEVSTTVDLLAHALAEVATSCNAVVESSYPFVRGSTREVGLVDFGRVFGPSGVLDQFFRQKLAKYADTSRKDWAWKTSDPVGRVLSPSTLRTFQSASRIRDAFFSEGSSQPFFMVTVTPPNITDQNTQTTLNFYGTSLVTKAGNGVPTGAPWPGTGSYQIKITTSVTQPPNDATKSLLAPATPPPTSGEQTATLVDKSGVWAIFHLLDDAGKNGNRVSFYSGGQSYQYTFSVAAAANPLDLASLRQFRCPANL